ncbi:aldehyde dehydrogenase family protein [Colwellia sp. UCD-KL20]|uniref:aldehyde dehydrogenase family protein n=1 Tax=Colwellia sp. UCD-KL20 TaxID=1917165 RepID=UPI000971134B|nr:aldehyde dehydrogenase family protein [Colwellia sp. UCD-KL20]
MKSIDIRNVRTGEYDYALPVFDANTVNSAVVQLRTHQKAWQNTSLEQRVKVVKQLAHKLNENKTELVDALIADTGRYQESVLEVDVVVKGIERWCEQAPTVLQSKEEKQAEVPFLKIKQTIIPYQVVGVISPWNFPLLLSMVDAIPALIAGCSIILKPSEVTSKFVTPFQKVLDQVPELSKVFSVVTGGGETGQAVIESVDSLCFTGSVATGQKVAAACAQRFIPAFLELGGKDPAIVCHDADPIIAAKALCWGSMVNAGQSCMSLERVYVHKDIAEAFITELTNNVAKLTHNYPDVKQGDIGPIISDKQVQIVQTQLQDAKDKGAEILCGGNVVELGGGSYCQPTILTHTSPDMLVIKDETFAAILPVVIVDSDQQAIELANDTVYGLSAAVFSQNIDYAHQVASELDAGAVSINDASLTALVHEMEKQSFKLSGLGGSRMGKESIFRFVRKKAHIRNVGVESPWWF